MKANGRILRPRGHLRLDEITRKRLLEWWTYEVINAGLSPKTGRNYLDAISAVPSYGRDLEIIDANPADDLRSPDRADNGYV